MPSGLVAGSVLPHPKLVGSSLWLGTNQTQTKSWTPPIFSNFFSIEKYLITFRLASFIKQYLIIMKNISGKLEMPVNILLWHDNWHPPANIIFCFSYGYRVQFSFLSLL